MSMGHLFCQHRRCLETNDDVASSDVRTLGSIRFSPSATLDRHPVLSVPMPVLGVSHSDGSGFEADDSAWCEALLTATSVHSGRHGDIAYAATDELLFGVVSLGEMADKSVSLQQATEAAYQQIFTLLNAMDYPYVWRYWNYMAAINEPADGLERYRQFNLGRQAAFEEAGRYRAEYATAACALGFGAAVSLSSGLCIAFLAGKTQPVPIENPRQYRAIDYPEQYGPRSPIFSRAALARLGNLSVLFVSGTASIVGHESVHYGDVLAQTRETLTNIEAIVAEANRHLAERDEPPAFSSASLAYRVYLRHAEDAPRVHEEMVRCIGRPVHALFLQADICRQDLLVEIESCPIVV